MSPPAAPRGVLCTSPDVQVKRWGESEAVAYSGANAKTHVVSEAAAPILMLAAGQGLAEAELALTFWADESPEAAVAAEDQALLRDTVDGLLAAGLLKRRA